MLVSFPFTSMRTFVLGSSFSGPINALESVGRCLTMVFMTSLNDIVLSKFSVIMFFFDAARRDPKNLTVMNTAKVTSHALYGYYHRYVVDVGACGSSKYQVVKP
jgi:hypothetical protein